MIKNCEYPCEQCNAQYVDTDIKERQFNGISKHYCARCLKKDAYNFKNLEFSDQPDFINDATKLELDLCSINMVNAYTFSLTRNSTKNRFKYQAIVLENDIENLFAKVLPRVPDTCRYLLLKRPNEKERPSEFRVTIDRIQKIIK